RDPPRRRPATQHAQHRAQRGGARVRARAGLGAQRRFDQAHVWPAVAMQAVGVRVGFSAVFPAHRGGRELSRVPVAMTPAEDRAHVTVRAVERADYDGWRPLWDGYNAFYERVGPTALPENITAATWERFFNDAEPMHAFVATLDGRIVGIVHYLFH